MSDLILPSNTARTDDLAALRTLAAGGTIGAMNYATGMGMPMYDPSRHTNMAAGVVPLDRGQQDRLMRSHKFIRKIIEIIPNQMTYRWGDLTLGGDDGDPDIINEVHTWLDNLNTKSLVNRYKGLKRAFNQAMKMAFQTGNAALVILAKDGQNFDRPININNLKSIEGLFLADRWSIQPDISGIYANLEMAEYFWLNDSRFNKIIQLRGGDMGRIRIHRSRVLWFRGEELSDRTLLENEGCDDSVLQGVQQSFQEYFQAIRGAGRMIVDFDVVVHKVAGLLANIDNDPSGKYQQKMMERAQINNICRSIWRSMLIDLEDEDIVHSTRNVSGYDSLLDRLVLDLQANTDLTKAELFNEYSKGLSATDKVEQENANNRTRMYQESKLDSNMYDFLKLVFACKDGPTQGKEPDKWEWKWQELYPVTPVEQAELELMRSQIDQINSLIGAYTGEEAAKSHYSGSEYNPEITINWKEREKLKAEQEKQQAEADKLAIQMRLLPGMEQPLLPGQPKQKALPGQQPGKTLPEAEEVTDSDGHEDAIKPEYIAAGIAGAGAVALGAHLLTKDNKKSEPGKPCGEGYISASYECRVGQSNPVAIAERMKTNFKKINGIDFKKGKNIPSSYPGRIEALKGNGLSDEEALSVLHYLSSNYEQINQVLYLPKEVYKEVNNASDDDYLNTLEIAKFTAASMGKLPKFSYNTLIEHERKILDDNPYGLYGESDITKKGQPLMRKIAFKTSEQLESYSQSIAEMKQFTHQSFMSTSSRRGGFTGSTQDKNEMYITVKPKKNSEGRFMDVSMDVAANNPRYIGEVIFLPGTNFKVKSVQKREKEIDGYEEFMLSLNEQGWSGGTISGDRVTDEGKQEVERVVRYSNAYHKNKNIINRYTAKKPAPPDVLHQISNDFGQQFENILDVKKFLNTESAETRNIVSKIDDNPRKYFVKRGRVVSHFIEVEET